MNLMDRNISVFVALDPKDSRAVAVIDGLPAHFIAPSPFKAKKRAEDWRRTEYERLTSKAQRAREARK